MNWLNELKPGDHVIVDDSGNITLREVEEITEDRIIIGSSHLVSAFNRRSGRQVHNDACVLCQLTDEKLDSMNRQEYLRFLRTANFNHLPSEVLQKACHLLGA